MVLPLQKIKPGRGGKRIDYTRLKFPKAVPDRDKAYLKFVRSQVCAAYSNECEGVTEAAHLGTTGRGMKTSDYLTVPLCTRHHGLSHSVGISTFQANEGVNLWEVAARLLVRWIRE